VAAGVAARSGHPISFMRFLRYGVPITVPCLLLCTLYLWLRFYQ
jgi:Na+/H+ antiporter NhaD/arsenite permease-like protein